MPSPVINRRVLFQPRAASGVAANSASAQAYFDRLVPYPTSAREVIYGEFVNRLVAAGLDSVFDFLYVCCIENQSNALTDVWRTDRQGVMYQATSGLTFTADSGFAGGSFGHNIRSAFNPSTASSPRFVRDDAMITVHVGSTATVNQPLIFQATDAAPGSLIANSIELYPRYSTGNAYICVNGVEWSCTAGADSSGLFVAQRTASNLTTLYRNGTSLGTSASTSTAVQAGEIRCGYGAQTFRLWGAGKSMTAPQLAAWQTAVETLITAIRGSLP